MFAEIFEDCKENKVFFSDGNYLDFKLSDKDTNLIYLKVTSDLSEMKSADVLDRFYCTLTKGKHRKDYYVVRTYSQASLTYCCKLMSYFGEFERQLRELLYLVVIKTYGENWFEETFEQQLGKEIEQRVRANNKITTESALEELTYEQLVRYIFTPNDPRDLENFFEEIKDESFFEKSQEEINKRIRTIRKLSLWEKLFDKNKKLADLKKYIEELRVLRNNTMHHKNISKAEFLEARKTLKFVNTKLSTAIEEIEKRNFAEMGFDYLESLKYILSAVAVDIMAIYNNLKTNFFEPLGKIIKAVASSYSEKNTIDFNECDVPLIEETYEDEQGDEE